MGRFIRKLIDLITFNFFYPISEKNVPKWVINASDKFWNKFEKKYRHRPYDKIIFLKGKNNIYKIWFECVGQAEIKTHYYKKSRTC
mgnify:CR=1 FL=1